MKKEDFIQQAALRLITVHPEEDMQDIARHAKDLADHVYGSGDDGVKAHAAFDALDVNVIVGHLEKKMHSRGYGVRLEKLFKANDIRTVGDLLRLGRTGLSRLRTAGRGTVSQLDDALCEMYSIQNW